MQRFREGFTTIPAMRKLGEVWDKDPKRANHLAFLIGQIIATELRVFDIDFSFTPVLDIDVKGAIKVQNVLGEDCLSIFIMPPSIEVLKERLLSRQTESAEAIQTRIDKAAYEIEFSSQFKAIVKNEVLEVACAEVAKLIENFIKTDVGLSSNS